MGQTNLHVILLKHTPNPEEVVATAAKLCYTKSNIDDLKEKIELKDQDEFIRKLITSGHMSPIEHASFTFAIEGISRACSHQLVRHRLASYSQQSQRYVSNKKKECSTEDFGCMPTFDFIIPPSIASDDEAKTIFIDFMKKAQQTYNFITEILNTNGLTGEAANQDARFVLPNAAETKIMVTMNARELLHFFLQRCCNRAQWEIQAVAIEMLRLVKKVSPTIFSLAGPGCLIGPCPEGDFSCGNIKEVRKKYAILQ
ncbi:MAG: FAD-dependent thymidylate synthase [Nitrospirae bacterium]|nr:FAD-dependent thymidylate synthase [Nitrospirota bacterium]